jgi:hypothetical protein
MSFSVYNAVRFPANMTVDQVFAWIDPLRAAVRLAADQAFSAELVREAVCVHDRAFLRRQSDPALAQPTSDRDTSSFDDDRRSALQNARGMILDEIRQAQRDHRRCHLDPEATLTVFRDDDGRLYGITHAQIGAIRHVVEAVPGLEDFSYSNATDAPKGISKKAWAAREVVWNRLLGSSSVPAERGAVFQLLSPDHFLLRFSLPSAGQVDSLLQDLPADHNRTARAIPRAMESAAWQERERALGTPLSRASEYMRRHRELSAGEDSSFNELCSRVEGLLPPITAARLAAAPEAVPEPGQASVPASGGAPRR